MIRQTEKKGKNEEFKISIALERET